MQYHYIVYKWIECYKKGLSCTPRYIPVQGQKQYCDLIRKLSGADSKDAKVEKLKSLFSFVGTFTTNQVWPGTRLPGGDNIRQRECCDHGET